MDLERIKQLMAAMDEHNIKKLVVKDVNGAEVELQKEGSPVAATYVQSPLPPAPAPSAPTHQLEKTQDPTQKVDSEQGGHLVTSPMVGTFYSSPSPDDPAFVKVGDTVTEESVICIIEAMKVMNEVKAGKAGKIVEICIENGSPIEYGTKLFRIE